MTVEDVLKVWKATPFRPFSLCLVDGRKVKVSRPDFIARSPMGREVAVVLSDESHVVVPLETVTSILVHPRGRAKKNGRKKS